jgi:hypothetical protein
VRRTAVRRNSPARSAGCIRTGITARKLSMLESNVL